MGGLWFAREPESCAGCGQVPPPLIGAALLPCAGKFSVLVIEAWKLFLLYSLISFLFFRSLIVSTVSVSPSFMCTRGCQPIPFRREASNIPFVVGE